MPYRYRVEVPTGYVSEVRDLIEPPDLVDAQVDGSIFTRDDDVTLVTVQSASLESLANLKGWVDAHPGEDLTVITMVGTPLSIREIDFESLRTSVMAHQTLDVETPAPRPGEMGR
jgi:hypothetical protein